MPNSIVILYSSNEQNKENNFTHISIKRILKNKFNKRGVKLRTWKL